MKPDTQSYYAQAESWAQSQADGARKARNLAFMVAGGAALIAIAEAIALASLVPLKSTSVVPVLVDRQTGFVQVLNKDGSQSLRADTALTRSMLAQYVAAREGFDITTLRADYRRVMLWSGGQARTEYAALMPAQNPQSPLKLYPRSALVAVNIESISDLGPRTAMVRFTTTRMDEGSGAGAPGYYAAVISYQFSDGPLRVEDRLINPLGFQVTRYRRSDEAAPARTAGGSSVFTMDIPRDTAPSGESADASVAAREP
jgi:type IV secretion system protein VirB8